MSTWQQIPGFEDYEASDQGQIRRAGQEQPKKLTDGVRGYLTTGLTSRTGVHKVIPVHQLVAAAFLGPRPEGWHTCHNNGDKHDNRIENLRYDTKLNNMLDEVRAGRHMHSRKTHCKHGHPFDEDNTRIRYRERSSGYVGVTRECRACQRNRLAA